MELVARLENLVSASCLMIDPKEQPMLLAEPPLNTQQHREKSDLYAYRYLLLSYVLTSFATTGHATSLVVDWSWRASTNVMWISGESYIVACSGACRWHIINATVERTSREGLDKGIVPFVSLFSHL
ncbi:unnamed protein product [Brassica rapa subsp. trilocularis]